MPFFSSSGAVALLLSLLAASAAVAADAAPGIVYHGATLIDGTAERPRPGMSILVNGETIESVLPDADALQVDAKRVDVGGLYVVPGLIDTHVHLATPPDAAKARTSLRRQLYAGVTSVRSMADDLRSVGELARQARVGEIPAPDIHYAALMAGPDFFDDPRTIAVTRGHVPGATPWMQAIDDSTDLTLAVAMARGTSASGIKLYANLSPSLVTRITAEAHRQGIPVWAHAAVFPAMPSDNVAANVDVISHSCPIGYEVSSPAPGSYQDPTPVESDRFADGMPAAITQLFANMAAQGILLDATNLVYARHEQDYARNPVGRPPRCSAELTYQLTRAAYLQGVRITSGTDGESDDALAWPALHDELEILAGPVGMPPIDVIRAATTAAADAIGAAASEGTIEAGKLANLVFLSAHPLDDIRHLRQVRFTVKRGKTFPRDGFQARPADAFAP